MLRNHDVQVKYDVMLKGEMLVRFRCCSGLRNRLLEQMLDTPIVQPLNIKKSIKREQTV